MKKRSEQKKGFLKENYARCQEFLQETRTQIKIALALFVIATIVGVMFPIFFTEEIQAFVEEMLASLEGLSTIQLIGYIFFNNLKASFFAMITGIAIGIMPVLTAVVNGYLLGYVSRAAIESGGILILWRLIPHGIFELPAIILSIGIGIKLGTDIFKTKQKRTLPENIKEAVRFFVFVIFPLLVIAAIIEGILIGFIK